MTSTLLTNICVFEDSLPQGSPCSPKLANLISWRLDVRVRGYAGRRGIAYTRYADDLTFSGLNPSVVSKIKSQIEYIAKDEWFEINKEKTHISGPSRAKKITGLVLSKDSFGIGKKKFNLLRAKLHYLTKPGQQNNSKLFDHTKGYLAFLKSVDESRYLKVKKYINNLNVKIPNTLISGLRIE